MNNSKSAFDYVASVRRFEEDGDVLYFAWYEQLGEGIHAIGESPSNAIESLMETMEDVIAVAEETGDELPEPIHPAREYSGRLTVRFSKTLHADLARNAHLEGVSLGALVAEILSCYRVWSTMTGLTMPSKESVVKTTSYTHTTSRKIDEKISPAGTTEKVAYPQSA